MGAGEDRAGVNFAMVFPGQGSQSVGMLGAFDEAFGEPQELAGATAADALDFAHRLRALGPRTVVITLGAEGAVFADGDGAGHVPGHRVERVVDTTGAGDATVGVLAAGLASGLSTEAALDRAMAAGAAAVQRQGAAASYPDFPLR